MLITTIYLIFVMKNIKILEQFCFPPTGVVL